MVIGRPVLTKFVKHPCFNGATTLQLRKYPDRRNYYIIHNPGFNGATTLQLRKSLYRIDSTLQTINASMGPQLYSCGNCKTCYAKIGESFASMGPQLYSCGNS